MADDTQPQQFRALLLDVKEIVLRGKVTSFNGYEMEVTCDGPWGTIVLDVPASDFHFREEFPRSDEIVEVRLR
jgi:hypothetical protein